MLFNSYTFIFIFLPIALIGFYLIGRFSHRFALSWLVGASLFFYSWWNPVYIWLIGLSVLVNYSCGLFLGKDTSRFVRKCILFGGLAFNLFMLGYFKYANFFVDNINTVFNSEFQLTAIILPLGISFFTFQQITFLVDTYKRETTEHDFIHYCIFVTFFPQLIAGPIVHHSEVLPQFLDRKTCIFRNENLAIGLTIFFIGLFKKVVLADGISVYATPLFNAAEQGFYFTFFDAWGGALAYTFQLYFDFSGYSDMAIGAARMFGILLPLNFASPYKAVNIIDFWKRWHITLSRFLRDYIYIPLGGNKKGEGRRYGNLIVTMFLGGLWHGAGWTFIIWGLIHGFFLVTNHVWNRLMTFLRLDIYKQAFFYRFAATGITFVSITTAWVIFRAESMQGAYRIIEGMTGKNGFVLPPVKLRYLDALPGVFEGLNLLGIKFSPMLFLDRTQVFFIIILFVITMFAPNTQQIMGRIRPSYESNGGEKFWLRPALFQWRPNVVYGVFFALLACYTVSKMTGVSEFLYFQF